MMNWLSGAAIILVPAILFLLMVLLSPTKRLEPHDRAQFADADAEARAALGSLQARSGGIGGMGSL